MFLGIVRVLRLELAETRRKDTVGRETFLDKHLHHVHGTFGRKVPVRVSSRTAERDIVGKAAHHNHVARIERVEQALADTLDDALALRSQLGTVGREQERGLYLDLAVFERE